MRKKIRFFRQHSEKTCGASCILMILDLYKRIQYPTTKMENKLYGACQSRAFCGITAAAIADCLSRNGFIVAIKHSSPNMMDNKNGYFSKELFSAFLKEYREQLDLCKDRVTVMTNQKISCSTLKKDLDAGRQIILECIVPGNADGIHEETLHWILVYGYQHEEFLVCDPLSQKIRLKFWELKRYMDTPIGKIYITIEEKEK